MYGIFNITNLLYLTILVNICYISMNCLTNIEIILVYILIPIRKLQVYSAKGCDKRKGIKMHGMLCQIKSLQNFLFLFILFTVICNIIFIEVVSCFVYTKTYFPSTCNFWTLAIFMKATIWLEVCMNAVVKCL